MESFEFNLDAYERQPDLTVRVELLLFAIARHKLKVLMLRRQSQPFVGSLVLPGCYLSADVSAWETAIKLRDRLGLSYAKLEDYGNASDPDRDPRGRCVSTLYLGATPEIALVQPTHRIFDSHLVEVQLRNGVVDLSLFDAAPSVGFDHHELIRRAVSHLQRMLDSSLIAFKFLPPEFTLLDLQQVHEVISGIYENKAPFRKRMLARRFANQYRLIKTGRMYQGIGRPAALYRLNALEDEAEQASDASRSVLSSSASWERKRPIRDPKKPKLSASMKMGS